MITAVDIGLSVGVYVPLGDDFPEFKVKNEATGATVEASVEGGDDQGPYTTCAVHDP